MNKNSIPKSESVATPDAAPAAAKPAPVATKAAAAATAAAPSKTATSTRVARVGRPPAAKAAVVKKAVVRKSARTTVAKVAAPAVKAAASKPVAAIKEKAKKSKLVRDSFTMPEVEYEVLGKVKKASLKAGFNVRKSELLRIGVALVDQLSAAQLQAALAGLMPLKAGRPKKDK